MAVRREELWTTALKLGSDSWKIQSTARMLRDIVRNQTKVMRQAMMHVTEHWYTNFRCQLSSYHNFLFRISCIILVEGGR